jgi:hypothetical protein
LPDLAPERCAARRQGQRGRRAGVSVIGVSSAAICLISALVEASGAVPGGRKIEAGEACVILDAHTQAPKRGGKDGVVHFGAGRHHRCGSIIRRSHS